MCHLYHCDNSSLLLKHCSQSQEGETTSEPAHNAAGDLALCPGPPHNTAGDLALCPGPCTELLLYPKPPPPFQTGAAPAQPCTEHLEIPGLLIVRLKGHHTPAAAQIQGHRGDTDTVGSLGRAGAAPHGSGGAGSRTQPGTCSSCSQEAATQKRF